MKYLPWVLIAVVLFFGWSWHERKVGELNGRIAHLVQEKARVDTLYKTNVKTLTRVRKVTDSVLAVDTLWRTDTVRAIVTTERQACDRVVLTCEQRVAVRDSIIKALKRKPSVWSHLPWIAAGVLGGVLLTK